MASTATRRTAQRREVLHTDARPTGRQVYALCHALADIAGLEWPDTRAAMSELLEHVGAQRAAITAAAPAADEEIPF